MTFVSCEQIDSYTRIFYKEILFNPSSRRDTWYPDSTRAEWEDVMPTGAGTAVFAVGEGVALETLTFSLTKWSHVLARHRKPAACDNQIRPSK